MNQSLIIGLSSFVLLVLIAAVFLYLHFKEQKDAAVFEWQKIREKTRLRIDMMPNLIETVRRFKLLDPQVIAEIIALRSETWPIEDITSVKVNKELVLSKHLHKIWEVGMQNTEASKDTNFLSLKNDLTLLGAEIESLEEIYNQKIRNYNKKINFIIFRPFLQSLRLQKMPIFEFEA